jgi:hypothetical protein
VLLNISRFGVNQQPKRDKKYLAKLLAIKVAIKELRSSRRRQIKTLSATKVLKNEF